MGKPTGFLEFNRVDCPAQSPEERIQHWNEFHQPLPLEQRKEQASRCMDCGVPFCQNGQILCGMLSGCPLHNLIPEWNDLLYQGKIEQALARLLMTNNFPEFTSRVCPALCEKACTCSIYDNPVSVRDNEYTIIEYGFANDLLKSTPPTVRSNKKIAVIGSGPAGLACADTLNHRGHSVTVYERSDRAGGLLMYGIPNMKLEKTIVERRTNLMQEEGVEFVLNCEVGKDISAEQLLQNYDAIILACGASHPRDITADGRDADGIFFAVDFLKSTTKSLLDNHLQEGTFISAKDKHVVVIGGGDTGNDCVGTAVRHGCASVVQLEMMPKLPDSRAEDNPFPEYPRICKTDYGQEEATAIFGHDPRLYQTTVKEFIKDDSGKLCGVKTVKLHFEKENGRLIPHEIEGSEEILPCELCLIAVGFLGCETNIPEMFGVSVDDRTNVKTAPDSHATDIPKVFTAGDMHIGQSLVVRAIKEGKNVATEVDAFLMGYTNLPFVK
ncbi:MAG TPA: glutamate synthase [Ruminococcus sp.]|nr:glutamate synthase [Ruminococcus sp.]